MRDMREGNKDANHDLFVHPKSGHVVHWTAVDERDHGTLIGYRRADELTMDEWIEALSAAHRESSS